MSAPVVNAIHRDYCILCTLNKGWESGDALLVCAVTRKECNANKQETWSKSMPGDCPLRDGDVVIRLDPNS